jgi:hypothetical protein
MSLSSPAEYGDFSRAKYGDVFVLALICVSSIPLIFAILNYEILNTSVFAIATVWSFVVVLGGAHVWITLAYYFDPTWLREFGQRPVVFFVIPMVLVAAGTSILAFCGTLAGLVLVYLTFTINIWHHSKQNWGILSLVAKARRVDVGYMRYPLIYAWPFFLASLALHLPEVSNFLGKEILRSTALVLAAAYIAAATAVIWRNQEIATRDPLVLTLAAALCLYFLPLATLYGKPYVLFITFSAHATQYYLLVFMSLSLSTWRSVDWIRIAFAFSAAATLIGLATYAGYRAGLIYGPASLWDSLLVRLIVGVTTGVNLVHFWLDAFIWKFSDRRMRQAHGQAFTF